MDTTSPPADEERDVFGHRCSTCGLTLDIDCDCDDPLADDCDAISYEAAHEAGYPSLHHL